MPIVYNKLPIYTEITLFLLVHYSKTENLGIFSAAIIFEKNFTKLYEVIRY